MKSKIRYAVVDLGRGSQVGILSAFKNAADNSELIQEVIDDYDSYEKLLRSGRVDAVYICVPNHLHESYATRALQAGVHVICEKPLALTLGASERLLTAAKHADKYLMTASRLNFEPANLETFEMCRKGRLGDLRYFSSDFSFAIEDFSEEGPLWDIGIYCIGASRHLFTAEPLQVMAFAETKTRDPHQVEEVISATLCFPDERLASFTVSFGEAAVSRYQICGTKGAVVLENVYDYPETRELLYMKDQNVETRTFKKSERVSSQLRYFSDCILNQHQPETVFHEDIADMRIILALYDSIENGKPVPLAKAYAENNPHI